MSTPTRFTGGLTQAAEFQPLGRIGIPDPFYNATFADDFLPYRAGDYTVTAAGGSVAASANSGTGGRILLTTGATIGNFAEIQQPTANFANVPGQQLAFLTRVNLADVVNSTLLAGLIDTRTTPFTPQDGFYFSKANGSNAITFNAISAGVVVGSVTVPPNPGFINGADLDLGFVIDRLGNIDIYAGYHLEGYFANQNRAPLGPTAKLRVANLTGAYTILPVNPTVALGAGTAVAQTGSVDFLFASQER